MVSPIIVPLSCRSLDGGEDLVTCQGVKFVALKTQDYAFANLLLRGQGILPPDRTLLHVHGAYQSETF